MVVDVQLASFNGSAQINFCQRSGKRMFQTRRGFPAMARRDPMILCSLFMVGVADSNVRCNLIETGAGWAYKPANKVWFSKAGLQLSETMWTSNYPKLTSHFINVHWVLLQENWRRSTLRLRIRKSSNHFLSGARYARHRVHWQVRHYVDQ